MKRGGPIRRKSGSLARGKPLQRGRNTALRPTRLEVTVRQLRADVFAEVKARDRHHCLLAGRGYGQCFGKLTPHHVRKSSQGGAYLPDNLVTLCAAMNDRIESDADFAREMHRIGLVIKRGDTVEDAWRRQHEAGLRTSAEPGSAATAPPGHRI